MLRRFLKWWRGPNIIHVVDSSFPEFSGNDHHQLQQAFKALWMFCCTEVQWMYFRDDVLDLSKDDPSESWKNAEKLREYLDRLKNVPVVAECLRESKR